MTEEKQQQHHVAWKDRLGLNDQWMRDIQVCSTTHGTTEYVGQVDRFKNDIINIHNGPPLYNIVEHYWNTELTRIGKELFIDWTQHYPHEAKIEEEVKEAQERIRQYQAEKLYHYIVQLLEDKGFGFYQSSIEMEENKM